MTNPPKPRGFAAMSPDRLRQVSSEAGKRSTSRPFRDVPGLAAKAGATTKPVTPWFETEEFRDTAAAAVARQNRLDVTDKHDHK